MRICAKCGIAKTNYVKAKIKMSNGKIKVLCKPCHKAWSKLFDKKYPKGTGEPQWSKLWNYFIRGYEVWSVS